MPNFNFLGPSEHKNYSFSAIFLLHSLWVNGIDIRYSLCLNKGEHYHFESV